MRKQEDVDAKALIEPLVTCSENICGTSHSRGLNMLCVKPVRRDHNRTILDLVCSCMFILLDDPLVSFRSNTMDLAVK